MENHTYADALRTRRETVGEEKSSNLVPEDEYPDPTMPHAVPRPQTDGNDEPGVTMEEILAGEALETASEDTSSPSLPTKCASSPEELFYLYQIHELYRRSMNTIHAWLAWEGYGSPGNTAQPTSRLIELAQRARWRDAIPGARQLWALEVAIDCVKIFQKVEGVGEVEGEEESNSEQAASMKSAVAV